MQTQEQLVRMIVRAPIELTRHYKTAPINFEEQLCVSAWMGSLAACCGSVVLRCVGCSNPNSLQVHLTNPLKRISEGIDRYPLSGVVNLNMVFSELGTEAFEQANLLIIEHNRLFLVIFLEAQQAVAFGVQVVTLSYATHTTRTDTDALKTFCRQLSGRKKRGVFLLDLNR